MKERPILFTGEMVRAILSGAKTQTRRVVKGLDIRGPDKNPSPLFDVYKGSQWVGAFDAETGRGSLDCPYGEPGDRLWVRETFQYQRAEDGLGLHYRADGARCGVSEQYLDDPDSEGAALVRADVVPDGRWKPSIHMPRWASRITLEVTGVRVERVQDISEEDAGAEGTPCIFCRKTLVTRCQCALDKADYHEDFQKLWDSVNAKRGYSWESNPWVWVVSFKQLD